MWTGHFNKVDPQTTKAALSGNSGVLSFRAVIELWCNNAEFREYFATFVSESPLDVFFWETPPVTVRTLDRPFEFVLVQAASLSRLQPDPSPFKSHFSSRRSEEVLTFPNLGGDAILMVPAPLANENCYTHLGRFLRAAPQAQVDALWRSVGLARQKRISSVPTTPRLTT